MFSHYYNNIVTIILQIICYIMWKKGGIMYFILQEMQIDLGDTPIENIFINDST